jgi:predicted GNAT family acetyltransferase
MSVGDTHDSGDAPRVVNNEAEQRYEVHVDGKLAGQADYHAQPGVITFPHTEVDPAYQGQGLAGMLAKTALDDARQQGLRVVPLCSFFATYIRRHPEYADLVMES